MSVNVPSHTSLPYQGVQRDPPETRFRQHAIVPRPARQVIHVSAEGAERHSGVPRVQPAVTHKTTIRIHQPMSNYAPSVVQFLQSRTGKDSGGQWCEGAHVGTKRCRGHRTVVGGQVREAGVHVGAVLSSAQPDARHIRPRARPGRT